MLFYITAEYCNNMLMNYRKKIDRKRVFDWPSSPSQNACKTLTNTGTNFRNIIPINVCKFF